MANFLKPVEKPSDFIDTLDSYINILYFREFDDMSNENLLDILTNLIDILNDMKVLENRFNFVNYGKDEQMGILERYMKSSVFKFGKDSEKVLIDPKKQIEYQYDYSAREYKRSELIVNVMNLSNIIAHRIQDLYEKGILNQTHSAQLEKKCIEEGISECNIQELIDEFFYLKDDCITELVECQKNGEPVNLYSYKDEQGRTVVGVWIPQYFEPFLVHSREDNQALPYIKEVEKNPYPNKTTFSFRVTPEQEEIFEWLEHTQWEGINARRIYAYLEAKRKFKEHEAKRQENSELIEDKEFTEIQDNEEELITEEQDIATESEVVEESETTNNNEVSEATTNVKFSETTYHMLTQLLLQKRASTEEKRRQAEAEVEEAQRILEEAKKKLEEAIQKKAETEKEWEDEEKALKELGIETKGEDEKGYE